MFPGPGNMWPAALYFCDTYLNCALPWAEGTQMTITKVAQGTQVTQVTQQTQVTLVTQVTQNIRFNVMIV